MCLPSSHPHCLAGTGAAPDTSSGAQPSSAAEAVEAEEKDLSPEEQQKRMRREIERTIASDPAAMAKMLETWLLEQKA